METSHSDRTSAHPNPENRPTWAEIDLEALAFNYHSVRSFVGKGIRYLAVVKADAYGHGALKCARRLQDEGVDWFGVATVEEGVELRQGGISRPILVMGGFWPGQIRIGLDNTLTPAVFTIEQASSIDRVANEIGTKIDVHLKFDTGMGRLGFPFEKAGEIAAELTQMKGLKIDGLMTHFASADDLECDLTGRQIERFELIVKLFREKGFEPSYLDLANSPGAVAHPASRSGMVRLGGVLYGLGGDVLPQGIEAPELRPVMSVRSRIAQLKTIRTGDSVGYSQTFVATRETRIASVPIGYHDGLRRNLSNTGNMIVRGRSAPIVGRISMDWTTIDVTDICEASVGDLVTVIGSDSGSEINAEDIARELGTISYEITCGIRDRVPRIISEEYRP